MFFFPTQSLFSLNILCAVVVLHAMVKLLSLHRTHVCMFIMMITVKISVSQPSPSVCSLDLPSSLPDSDTTCTGRDWGGFLSENCCGSSFPAYLFALSQRANRTGLIFLNSDEQRSCLAKMEKSEPDVLSCGIDKLTSGGGGCSDISVANATHRLGRNLKSLTQNCKFEGSEEEFDQFCISCVKSWQEIGQEHSISSNGTDVCRFAVLISLTSTRIHDESYIHRVYKCLENQKNQNNNIGDIGK